MFKKQLLPLFFISFLAVSNAQAPADAGSFFQTLLSYNDLRISIETDLTGLRSQDEQEVWQAGKLSILRGDSVLEQHTIKISTRGRMRKQTCKYPPVKIRLDDVPPANDSIAEINELKMVIACNDNKMYEKLVLKEQVVYRMYNILTQRSFRTKSATTIFIDSEQKKDAYETNSFFIESEKELAARIGGKPLKSRIVPPNRLEEDTYNLLCLFEFMIGNTDWAPKGRHNVKLIGMKGQHPVPVPYDFDYSGMVSAHYAIPAHDLPIENVRERYFMGLCRATGAYQPTFDLFVQHKTELFECIKQTSGLPEKDIKEMTEYLQEFYDILESPNRTKRSILDKCVEED